MANPERSLTKEWFNVRKLNLNHEYKSLKENSEYGKTRACSGMKYSFAGISRFANMRICLSVKRRYYCPGFNDKGTGRTLHMTKSAGIWRHCRLSGLIGSSEEIIEDNTPQGAQFII
jgi:hypothetical protein